LEAAPTSGTAAWTDAPYAWSGNTSEAIGAAAQGTAIGTGYRNTQAMVTQSSTADRAGTIARAYRGPNNLSDWYLPSKNELNQLYIEKARIGGFWTDWYWSSSEVDATEAWPQYFGNGLQYGYFKTPPVYVRPVRAFGGTLACADGGVCAVGATGPSGGIIFYKDLTRPAGSQYFEVACAGWSDGTCGGNDLTDPEAKWGCYGDLIAGADGTAIGTGAQNTTDITAIVDGCQTSGIAARLANDLTLGGQSDWFLPSLEELNQMYTNLHSASTPLGSFSSDLYWSSSEFNDSRAWYQHFNSGNQINLNKNFSGYVRPVRAF
jgi:hypothetical protein